MHARFHLWYKLLDFIDYYTFCSYLDLHCNSKYLDATPTINLFAPMVYAELKR